MPSRSVVGRRFLAGGVLVMALGLAFRLVLPLTGPPPYLLTGLLAIAYGLFCLLAKRPAKGASSAPP